MRYINLRFTYLLTYFRSAFSSLEWSSDRHDPSLQLRLKPLFFPRDAAV